MFQGNIKIASYFLNFFSLTIGIPDPGVYFPILNFDTSAASVNNITRFLA